MAKGGSLFSNLSGMAIITIVVGVFICLAPPLLIMFLISASLKTSDSQHIANRCAMLLFLLISGSIGAIYYALTNF